MQYIKPSKSPLGKTHSFDFRRLPPFDFLEQVREFTGGLSVKQIASQLLNATEMNSTTSTTKAA
jgi:hypothetical protein